MNNTKKVRKQKVTPFFEVHQCIETGYKSMFATQDLKPSITLSKFDYHEILSKPTRFTIQISEHQHIALKPTYLQYINHSCSPNVFFDTKMMELKSLRFIQSGTEVAFFYPSTEWKMNEPFNCSCVNDECLQQIKGASFLNQDSLTKYRLNDFVLRQRQRSVIQL